MFWAYPIANVAVTDSEGFEVLPFKLFSAIIVILTGALYLLRGGATRTRGRELEPQSPRNSGV